MTAPPPPSQPPSPSPSPGTATLRSVDCTNCGAGLPVLGGGRVTTQICGYCGASLDANDAYRVLAVHAGMERPASPFRIGMAGEIDGARYTITGTLGFVERDRDREWRWTDHMLFSPTHGYAWLTVEDGHVLFARKTRDWPDGGWVGETLVETSEARPGRRWRGRNFVYFASSSWLCDFAEGEFNFRPARGDRGYSASLMSKSGPPTMLTYLEARVGAREREVDATRLAPEAPEAFGAAAPAPEGLHPLTPYAPSEGARFYAWWFGAMTAATALLLFVVLGAGGTREVLIEADARTLPAEAAFDVADTGRPVQIELRTGLKNAWVEMALDVTGPDGAPVVSQPVGLSYYEGYEDGERWSEGSRDARLGFVPPAPGAYRVALSRPEGEVGSLGAVQVSAREGMMTARWPVLALVLFGALTALSLSGRLIHATRRWSQSDWSEE